MADTSPQDSSDVLHYHASGEPAKRRSASVAPTVIAIILAVVAGFLAFKLQHQNTAFADLRTQLDRANSENTAVKAELANANTKSANLQTQLDQAQKQQADLQAQAKKTEELGANLQAELQKAQADLKTQQENSQSQLADAQAQFASANDKLTGLRKELTTAKSQIDDLNSQLAKAKEAAAPPQPVAAPPAARALPLTTEFKKSFFGGNFTLHLKNTGPDPLKLNIEVSGSDKTPSKSVTVKGGDTFKLDGLAAGAKVVVASEGFESVTLTAQ